MSADDPEFTVLHVTAANGAYNENTSLLTLDYFPEVKEESSSTHGWIVINKV